MIEIELEIKLVWQKYIFTTNYFVYSNYVIVVVLNPERVN